MEKVSEPPGLGTPGCLQTLTFPISPLFCPLSSTSSGPQKSFLFKADFLGPGQCPGFLFGQQVAA